MRSRPFWWMTAARPSASARTRDASSATFARRRAAARLTMSRASSSARARVAAASRRASHSGRGTPLRSRPAQRTVRSVQPPSGGHDPPAQQPPVPRLAHLPAGSGRTGHLLSARSVSGEPGHIVHCSSYPSGPSRGERPKSEALSPDAPGLWRYPTSHFGTWAHGGTCWGRWPVPVSRSSRL